MYSYHKYLKNGPEELNREKRAMRREMLLGKEIWTLLDVATYGVIAFGKYKGKVTAYEGLSKSFRTGRLGREL